MGVRVRGENGGDKEGTGRKRGFNNVTGEGGVEKNLRECFTLN